MATLICPESPSPVADAEALRKAVQGWGTNEKAVISILGHRNASQRKLIRHAYEEMYQEDLLKRLEKELSGDFEKAVYRWVLDPAERDAVLANVAIKARPIDYHVIVEISCIHPPEELFAVKHAYQKLFKRSLEEDLAAHTTGELRQLLVSLVSVGRYKGNEINAKLAKSEAHILHTAIKEKTFNNEEVIRIVSTRSKAQLMATVNHYKDDHGASITKHLVNDPDSDYLGALRTTIRSISDPQKYFEKQIRLALHKSGTDENVVTRVIVTRAEKDLEKIKELYHKRNSIPLEQAVAKETSGDYKAFLLALLGKAD